MRYAGASDLVKDSCWWVLDGDARIRIMVYRGWIVKAIFAGVILDDGIEMWEAQEVWND